MSDEDWFEPKRFGYGAGLPIAWQGWAVMLGFCAVVLPMMILLLPRHPVIAIALVVILNVPLMVICARHTRGGWKWRWGGDE
jgi:hypothetical protein